MSIDERMNGLENQVKIHNEMFDMFGDYCIVMAKIEQDIDLAIIKVTDIEQRAYKDLKEIQDNLKDACDAIAILKRNTNEIRKLTGKK